MNIDGVLRLETGALQRSNELPTSEGAPYPYELVECVQDISMIPHLQRFVER
jgi:hypothetical protein